MFFTWFDPRVVREYTLYTKTASWLTGLEKLEKQPFLKKGLEKLEKGTFLLVPGWKKFFAV